jgi:hypothetical protein
VAPAVAWPAGAAALGALDATPGRASGRMAPAARQRRNFRIRRDT